LIEGSAKLGSAKIARGSNTSPRLALVSSGLGNTNRGFEISTARWFEALKSHTDLDVRLYCGGKYAGGKALWNFPRNSIWTQPAHYLPFFSERKRWEVTYGAEQISFWSALNFELLAWQPDVLWVKDYPLVHFLSLSRKMFSLHYKIIFANGGMKDPKSYQDIDYIQQIQESAFNHALSLGLSSERMEVLPNCIPSFPGLIDRSKIRDELGIECGDWAIICIAAWNRHHKRIDYLLEEVAAITDRHVKLILCGTPEVGSESLKAMGKKLLGDRVQWLTVDNGRIGQILQACDVFVLPTLDEFFGNSLIEAALCGLPVVTHPHTAARYAINSDFWYTDLSQKGNLTARLLWLQENRDSLQDEIDALTERLKLRFDEEKLALRFRDMVLKVVQS